MGSFPLPRHHHLPAEDKHKTTRHTRLQVYLSKKGPFKFSCNSNKMTFVAAVDSSCIWCEDKTAPRMLLLNVSNTVRDQALQ